MAVEKVSEKAKASIIRQNQNGMQMWNARLGSVSDGKLTPKIP
jgi:hypothetical protein